MSKDYMNIKKLKTYFPIFDQKINGFPFIYFDSASTAQVPFQVIDAMNQYYMSYKSNVGRGVYTFAERATYAYEHSRKRISQFIGAKQSEILFTSNATTGINIVAQSWAAFNLQSGDEILVSQVEHHSNFLPWQELAQTYNLIVKIVPVQSNGVVDYEQLVVSCTSKTKLISIFHTSNVTGGTCDIKKIISFAHNKNIAVLIDASQSIAHQKIDVQAIGCDFLVFSGHKIFGPTGIGILYVASKHIPTMKPCVFGGGMVYSVGPDCSEYRSFPHGFEPGTPNVAGSIGLGAAIDFVEKNINFYELAQYETMLAKMMIDGLLKIPYIKILSAIPKNVDEHIHMVTFVSEKYHAHDIAAYLDRFGIAVRAGNHCAQLFHKFENINASVRISFSLYNSVEEVAFCLQKLRELFTTD